MNTLIGKVYDLATNGVILVDRDLQVVDLPVPMGFGIRVQSTKDNGQNDIDIFADEVDDIFVLLDKVSTVTHLNYFSNSHSSSTRLSRQLGNVAS